MEKDGLFFRSGDLFLNKRMRKFLETFLIGSYDSSIYITYWSILHFISGIITSYILHIYAPNIQHPYSVGFAGHTLWEGWQVYIGMSRPWNWKGHNGFTDFTMDTALFMAGMYAYNWFA
jgi:hypothetical protein